MANLLCSCSFSHSVPVHSHRWPCLTQGDIIAKCLPFSLPFMALTTSLPTSRECMEGQTGLGSEAVTWGQGTSSSPPPPSASSTQPAFPASHVALARKACNRLAPSPALIGLGVGPGTGAPPPVRGSLLWDEEETQLGALHGGPLHVLPPDLPDSSLGCSAAVLLPSHSPTKSRPSR